MAVLIGPEFVKKYRRCNRGRHRYQREALKAIKATLRQVQRSPHLHDGNQPGTLPEQVRQFVSDTRFRIIYRLPDENGDIYIDDLWEVKSL